MTVAVALSRLALDDFAFEFGGHRVSVAAARNQDALLAATRAHDHIPFGLMLWEASIPLCERLVAQAEALQGRRVLELGAGVGLAGIVAAKCGADVTQVEIDPLAVALAERNAARSGVAGRLQVAIGDWSTFAVDRAFDIVIGADVVYDVDAHGPVAALLSRAVAPGGRFVLADPARATTPAFLRRLEADGWRLTVEERQLPDLVRPDRLVTVQVIAGQRAN